MTAPILRSNCSASNSITVFEQEKSPKACTTFSFDNTEIRPEGMLTFCNRLALINNRHNAETGGCVPSTTLFTNKIDVFVNKLVAWVLSQHNNSIKMVLIQNTANIPSCNTVEFRRLGQCFLDWATAVVGEADRQLTWVTFTNYSSGPIWETSAQSMELSVTFEASW